MIPEDTDCSRLMDYQARLQIDRLPACLISYRQRLHFLGQAFDLKKSQIPLRDELYQKYVSIDILTDLNLDMIGLPKHVGISHKIPSLETKKPLPFPISFPDLSL